LYPLNGRHGISDIGPNKNPPGIPSDIRLAPGPYGHPQGSYQFSGSFTSYIEFLNNGGLDTRYSITVLAWVNRENNEGPIFHYTGGFHLWIWAHGGSVFANIYPDWAVQPHSYISPNIWYYAGVTYDFSSGIAKVWVNGQAESEVRNMQYTCRSIKNLKHKTCLIAELPCGLRPQSGSPWVRKFGNLSIREILVLTSAYARPPVQTLGEGEGSPQVTRRGGGKMLPSVLGRKSRGDFGQPETNQRFSWREIA